MSWLTCAIFRIVVIACNTLLCRVLSGAECSLHVKRPVGCGGGGGSGGSGGGSGFFSCSDFLEFVFIVFKVILFLLNYIFVASCFHLLNVAPTLSLLLRELTVKNRLRTAHQSGDQVF